MFKAINTSNEARVFQTYAAAYDFVMKEGDRSRLWSIIAARASVLTAARAEKAAFNSATFRAA